jgi:hypothetical protein
MYYIDRINITNASFLAGGVAEPSATETEWVSGGTYSEGQERIRSGLHRVFRCAAPRSPSTTPPSSTPPENDPTGWVDMRATDRWLPFGPHTRADGLVVYQSRGLESDTADIVLCLAARYADSVALFGLLGNTWKVDVCATPGGAVVETREGPIKQPAMGYWDYAFGKRRIRDRVLVTGLPRYPNAEVRITISGGSGVKRRISQCEIGALRSLPGLGWGGVLAGLSREPRAFTYTKNDPNGDTSVLIYGNTYNMSGRMVLPGANEDAALKQLRDLLGKGVAFAPTLAQGFEQSLVFGILTRAPTTRDSVSISGTNFEIEGLPT